MAKKDKSFGAKVTHNQTKSKKAVCPVCNTPITPVVLVADAYSDKGDWRPRKQRIKVCNCNKAEIYG